MLSGLRDVIKSVCPKCIRKAYRNLHCYGTLFAPANVNTRKYWNDRLSKVGDFWRDEPYHVLLTLLPPDERFTLLDIGCAIGDGCELLQRKFPNADISGVDISPVGIKEARARGSRVKYSVLDINRDSISGLYDYVTIVETLEHLDDPFLVVDKCLSHTICGLYVSVPYEPHLSPGRVEGRGEHLWAFSEYTFAGYGARVISVDTLNEGTMPRILFEIRPRLGTKRPPRDTDLQ